MVSDLVLKYRELEAQQSLKKQELESLQREIQEIGDSLRSLEKEIVAAIGDRTVLLRLNNEFLAIQANGGKVLFVPLVPEENLSVANYRSETMPYAGWKNYATWAVHTRLTEEDLFPELYRLNHSYTEISDLADALQKWVEELPGALLVDLPNVDWQEIAEFVRENYPIDDEE